MAPVTPPSDILDGQPRRDVLFKPKTPEGPPTPERWRRNPLAGSFSMRVGTFPRNSTGHEIRRSRARNARRRRLLLPPVRRVADARAMTPTPQTIGCRAD